MDSAVERIGELLKVKKDIFKDGRVAKKRSLLKSLEVFNLPLKILCKQEDALEKLVLKCRQRGLKLRHDLQLIRSKETEAASKLEKVKTELVETQARVREMTELIQAYEEDSVECVASRVEACLEAIEKVVKIRNPIEFCVCGCAFTEARKPWVSFQDCEHQIHLECLGKEIATKPKHVSVKEQRYKDVYVTKKARCSKCSKDNCELNLFSKHLLEKHRDTMEAKFKENIAHFGNNYPEDSDEIEHDPTSPSFHPDSPPFDEPYFDMDE